MNDRELLDFIESRNLTLISNSMGGWVVMWPITRRRDVIKTYNPSTLREALETFAKEAA